MLSGPSGAGKNSVMNAVFPTIPNLKYSVSVTTRPPRVGEVHAVNYFFVSEEEFDKMLAADLLLESATFVGYRYGTPKKYVYEQIEAGNAVIMDIDIQGAAQIKRKMPEAVLVFLLPPTPEELSRRLRLRGSDSEEVIKRRLAKSREEVKHIVDYDYFIINDDLNKAAEQLRQIILSEWCRVSRIDLDYLQQIWKGGSDLEATES
ncbi:MAG: guanylate kinase [Limnochordia bacterium]|nr:guanylate kinase [Limnochordia bacterium]MDI9464814.1 guanylate kinase [Bacillota bacterium]HOB39720.1 guanylate kinase [Limnochordia bacterium]HOK31845.1 guanylate kinase [Limnochordia bacterium]HOL99729.1 guanylate kinase [Limnochordia bacterium]